jgi:Holliday junction resolvase RusA-like endonuclease
MIINLNVKPMSVNKAWAGRRFKTKEYKEYERLMLMLMPNIDFKFKGNIGVNITFGFSNKTSDIDNPLKLVLDILQKKYKFNDRSIYELYVKKELTAKKEEYIKIHIYETR